MSATVTNTVTTAPTLTTTTSSPLNPVDVTDHHNHNHNDADESLSEIVLNSNENGNEPNGNTTMVVDNQKNYQKSNWVKFEEDGESNNINNNQSNGKNQTVAAVNTKIPLTTISVESKTINTLKSSPQTSKVEKAGEITIIPGPPPAQDKLSSSSKPSVENTTSPAVLTHINLNTVTTSSQTPTLSSTSSARNEAAPKTSTSQHQTNTNNAALPMRTIELSTGRVREGFANGDIIVTLLPTNTKWPWITPAVFRPELVPEELMAQGLTLTVEEYVNAMETLVNDYRFTVYNICYKRVLVCWILFAFCVLLTLLFSGLKGIALFSLGVGWLFLNAAAIFFCMWIKLRLSRGLEKCLARVNKQLVRHKILLILDDRGRISCHKVNLCFLYFDPAQCIAYLNEYIERSEQNGANIQAGWEAKLDVDVNDIVIQGSNPVRLSRKQAIAQEIFLSYLQRWGKDFLRRRLDWTVNEAGVHEMPRHLMSSICPCQYIEEILNNKIKLQSERSCCSEFFQNSCRSFC